MKQYNKIGLTTIDGFTSAFVDTPIGRFIINAGNEEGYDEGYSEGKSQYEEEQEGTEDE